MLCIPEKRRKREREWRKCWRHSSACSYHPGDCISSVSLLCSTLSLALVLCQSQRVNAFLSCLVHWNPKWDLGLWEEDREKEEIWKHGKNERIFLWFPVCLSNCVSADESKPWRDGKSLQTVKKKNRKKNGVRRSHSEAKSRSIHLLSLLSSSLLFSWIKTRRKELSTEQYRTLCIQEKERRHLGMHAEEDSSATEPLEHSRLVSFQVCSCVLPAPQSTW